MSAELDTLIENGTNRTHNPLIPGTMHDRPTSNTRKFMLEPEDLEVLLPALEIRVGNRADEDAIDALTAAYHTMQAGRAMSSTGSIVFHAVNGTEETVFANEVAHMLSDVLQSTGVEPDDVSDFLDTAETLDDQLRLLATELRDHTYWYENESLVK